jgi:hypothetical protein
MQSSQGGHQVPLARQQEYLHHDHDYLGQGQDMYRTQIDGQPEEVEDDEVLPPDGVEEVGDYMDDMAEIGEGSGEERHGQRSKGGVLRGVKMFVKVNYKCLSDRIKTDARSLGAYIVTKIERASHFVYNGSKQGQSQLKKAQAAHLQIVLPLFQECRREGQRLEEALYPHMVKPSLKDLVADFFDGVEEQWGPGTELSRLAICLSFGLHRFF